MNQSLSAANGVPVVQFSSDMFAPRERVAAWREFIGREFFKLEIEPYGGDAFRAETALRALPGLGVFTGEMTSGRLSRPNHLIDDDGLVFMFPRTGTMRYAACGREAHMGPGEAVCASGAEGCYTDSFEGFSYLSLLIPRQAVASSVINLDDSIARKVPARTPALLLLKRYLAILDDAEALATPALQRQIATDIIDLVTLAVGATCDAAEIAEARGGRAARQRAIVAGVEQHLTNPALSAAWLGARLGLSDRYVHHLLAGTGVSFSELVRNKRVERARRMLEQPSLAPRRIIDVAYAVGFADLSNFNRAFRRHFGCTPSDVVHRREGGAITVAR